MGTAREDCSGPRFSGLSNWNQRIDRREKIGLHEAYREFQSSRSPPSLSSFRISVEGGGHGAGEGEESREKEEESKKPSPLSPFVMTLLETRRTVFHCRSRKAFYRFPILPGEPLVKAPFDNLPLASSSLSRRRRD
jgi:hypothetical protein